MSYAVIQTGGKQYKVRSGEILKIERLPNTKSDAKVEFKEILAYGDDKIIEVGAPTVQGAKVEANLIKNSKLRLSISATAYPAIGVNPGFGEGNVGAPSANHRIITLSFSLNKTFMKMTPFFNK